MSTKLRLPMILAAALGGALVSAAEGRLRAAVRRASTSRSSRHARPPAPSSSSRAADFNAPTITVVKPDPQWRDPPPVDIDVRFKPAQGASVNIASLKIMYGFLKLDITQRILKAPGVQVTAGWPEGQRGTAAERQPQAAHRGRRQSRSHRAAAARVRRPVGAQR